MECKKLGRSAALVVHRPNHLGAWYTHWGARPSQSECFVSLQTEIFISFITCPGGWSQTIQQVKKPDLEVLGWCGYMWSAVVRLPTKAGGSLTTLEASYGREININFSGNSSGGHSCSQHANCTLPQN
jgi:hypothetical protein